MMLGEVCVMQPSMGSDLAAGPRPENGLSVTWQGMQCFLVAIILSNPQMRSLTCQVALEIAVPQKSYFHPSHSVAMQHVV